MTKIQIPLRISYSGDQNVGTTPRYDETEVLNILDELKTDSLAYMGIW